MRLVIDSNIFVSSLDPKDVFHEECYPILEKMLSFDIEALCPSLVLVETICVLRRRTNSEQVALAIYQNLSQLPAIIWLDMNLHAVEKASMLGGKTAECHLGTCRFSRGKTLDLSVNLHPLHYRLCEA